MASAINIEDLRIAAQRRLPYFLSEYVERGAGDGRVVRRNVESFRRYDLLPKGLLPVRLIDTSRELFGRRYSLPFGISAVGGLGLFRRNAEEILAEVACEADIPFMLSGVSNSPIERIARLAPNHVWFQLYAANEPQVTEHLIKRAQDSGVDTLVITVDFPVRNQSEISARTGVSLAGGVNWRNAPAIVSDVLRHPSWAFNILRYGGPPKLESWEPYSQAGSRARQISRRYSELSPANLLWQDVEAIRKAWTGRLILKGLVHLEDIQRAAAMGIDAVTVSNHGGNRLDRMPASVDLLARIHPSINDKLPLLFDGGIRRGSDLVTALALGAAFCFVGRAMLYGVAAGGSAGARRAVAILRNELEYTQAMIGCSSLHAVGRGALA